MRDTVLYLKDIAVAINSILEFVEDMTFEAFQRDDKTASAVLRKFEIIGEAAKQVPEGIRMRHPDIPWKEMAGMRDRLIHGYFGADLHLVWMTVKNRLPSLEEQIADILSEIRE